VLPAKSIRVACQLHSREAVAGEKAVPIFGEQNRHVATDRAPVDAEVASDAAQHAVPSQAVFPEQASHLAAALRALESTQGVEGTAFALPSAGWPLTRAGKRVS
jgi:hypothetical protein